MLVFKLLQCSVFMFMSALYACSRVCFLVCIFLCYCLCLSLGLWELLLQQVLYVRVKFETAHCQPVISVTRNKSDKNEFIPEHKLNVNAFGKNCHETSISRILCPCFDQLVFVIA